MADDLNIGSDALLVTTLNDNDRVTITRQATAQQVATMKVADFRNSLRGVDYSLLTEQIVPGEFWRDNYNALKQVYQKTLLGTVSSDKGTNTTLIQGVKFVKYVEGGIIGYAWGGLQYVQPGFVRPFNNEIYPGTIYDFHYNLFSNSGTVYIAEAGNSLRGQPFSITLKYIK